MASDMVVALARATADRHALFGHNNNGLAGQPQALVRSAGRPFTPGEVVRDTRVPVPQVRQTLTVLAARSGAEWGYQCGVNERGVAIGLTAIHSRLAPERPGLMGPDLVRLGLERAASARQAIEVITDLINRFGQGEPDGEGGRESALVILDASEACVLEACGAHWALQMIGQVKAVSGNGLLRRDWDRISRGLSDLACARGWWPGDGTKLDFAGALGWQGPGHAAAVRRWGQATRCLEEQSGQLDSAFFRRLLREQAEAVAQARQADLACSSSFLVRLSPDPDGLPLAWWAPGSPARSIYFPLSVAGELPDALADQHGTGSRAWRSLAAEPGDSPREARTQAALRAGLTTLQERFDQEATTFAQEAAGLRRRGERRELEKLAAAFMQRNADRFEELVGGLPPPHQGPIPPPHRPRTREEEYAYLGEGDF